MDDGSLGQQTLDRALATDLANFYYQPLLDGLRTLLAGRMKAPVVEKLKRHAVAQWQLTADHAVTIQLPEIRDFVLNETIPSIERSVDLLDQVFILFFFVDAVSGSKRFWCPGSSDTLIALGRPYSDSLAVDGMIGVTGLKDWEVPLSSRHTTGIRGDLAHQHAPDLTDDQLAGRTYNPAGDWLVGIKSVVFIGIPDEQAQEKRSGHVCFCATVPNIFGTDKIRESDAGGRSFFRPYVELVNAVKPARQREFPSFPQYFEKNSIYQNAGSGTIARNWIYQTIGLRHKSRLEAEYVAHTAYGRISKLLEVVDAHSSSREIFQQVGLEVGAIQAELSLIREIELSRLRFYGFLSRFGHRALGDKTVPARDQEWPTDSRSLVAALKRLESQIRLTLGRCPKVEITIAPEVAEKIADLDWGAFEFIVHQLLENAADKGSSDPIDVALSEKGDHLVLEVSNVVKVIARQVPGSRACCHSDIEYHQLVGQSDWLCSACLAEKLRKLFDGGLCWEPTQNGGRFGLFMIRNFIRGYYNGSTHATIRADGPKWVVTFAISVPLSPGESR